MASGAARQNMPTIFRLISPIELESLRPPFVELLREAVNGGAALGFLPPLTHDESWDYWQSLRETVAMLDGYRTPNPAARHLGP